MKVSIMLSQILDHSTYSTVKTLDKVKLTSMLLNMCYYYYCAILDKMEKKDKPREKKITPYLKPDLLQGIYIMIENYLHSCYLNIFSLFSYISADLGSAKTRNRNIEGSKQNLLTQDFQRRLTVNK